MSIFDRAYSIVKKNGPAEFLRRGVRLGLPSTGYYTYNSVIVGKKRLFDPFLVPNRNDKPHMEDGIVSSHKALTRSGDSVVIIGGGSGITAVRAATLVGKKGNVTVYEGAEVAVKRIRKIIKMNAVEDRCEVNHAIIGQDRDVWGKTNKAEITHPSEIHPCDVLELDCEGSEIDILESLDIRPRVIIVELHPMNFSEPPEKPIEILSDYGYNIVNRFGHDGKSVSDEEFSTLLFNSSTEEQKYIESGARWPVVLAATRTEKSEINK